MPQDCECEGFEDCARMTMGGPEHYTRTIHEEDCPESDENRMERAMDRVDQERKERLENPWDD